MPEYTRHQQKIIERYYDRRDEIMLSKLGEIVTELFLAEDEAKAKRLWERAAKAMRALRIPESISSHITSQRDPETLARNLKQWLAAAQRGGSDPAPR